MCAQREIRRERGLTLLEQIMFIVVIGIAAAGVAGVIGYATRASTEPMIHKQALAIAEALLEEAQLMPFTYCDPDDPQAATALSATVGPTGCSAGGVEGPGLGAEGAAPFGPETRVSATTPYDNVNDYNGFTMAGGIVDIAGNPIPIPELASYTASVTVATQGLGGIGASEALLITVTVSHPNLNPSIVLNGYRVRYAPNALP
jgi:MSHA pilin protein MshD